MYRVVIYKIIEIFECFFNLFFSFKLHDLDLAVNDYDFNNDDSDVAIVVQGPLLLKRNFTYRSCSNLVKAFPKSLLILSTWEGEDEETIGKVRGLGFIVLLNKLPKDSGLGNVNYQISSTYAGAEYAKTKGAKYLLKIRTDHIILKNNVLNFFKNMLNTFDLKLLTLSENSYEMDPYRLGDRVMFGSVDSMMVYWQPCDSFNFNNIDRNIFKKWELNKSVHSLLFLRFLSFLNEDLDWSLLTYHRLMIKHFVLIDSSSIGLYWYKYFDRIFVDRNFYGVNSELNPCMRKMSFLRWLYYYRKYNNA
ncbi:WavE lipopolysaccharide synthesis family protein [Halobacteriovorax sp. CON-3]|uniref:WavE lipopolysaccharide synthesis family protein n=1 Tax=Halobacteriovorax sp. CON-3 TaxID=3157710 RepID=UPI003710835A